MQFDFAYGRSKPLLLVLAMGPNASSIELTDTSLNVRMGWAFKTSIPLSAITNVQALDKTVISIGVHGWAGRWLVNGAGNQLVQIDIDPRVPARSAFVPLKLKTLTLSVEHPIDFARHLDMARTH